MHSYSNLKQKIEKGLAEQRKKGNLNGNYKIDMLILPEELKKYSNIEILVASFEHKLIITMCSACDSVKVNGKWVQESNYASLLRLSYPHISFGVCDKHEHIFTS